MLAFKFSWSSPSPDDVYWYYLDVYGGSVPAYTPELGYFFATVFFYDFAGEETTTLSQMSNHSYTSYDLTQTLNRTKPFNGSLAWEAPVNGWNSSGPIGSCGFTPTTTWTST